MNCVRAIAIFDSLLRAQLTATPQELDELIGHELLAPLDPWILTSLAGLRDLWQSHAGAAACDPNAFWNPSWLQIALSSLEAKLRSDFHRTVTSNEKLDRQERERVAMRRGLGLLMDQEARTQAQRTAQIQATLLSPNARLVPCLPDPAPVYGMTRMGEAMLAQVQARQTRYGAVPLAEFLRSFRKAHDRMQQLTQQVRAIDAGLGYVRKGKHQVVAGLIKSGLPVQQAVSAFQQAQQRVRRAGTHPAEPPHLAVTLVRHAMDTKSVDLADQRMVSAEKALLRRGIPAGPATRGAAKSLLGSPNLEAAADRFVELCGWLQPLVGRDENLLRYAARLMPVQSSPRQLAQRCQVAARMLAQGGYANQGRIDATSVALAALSSDDTALGAVVTRFADIVRRIVQGQMGSPSSAVNPALELTACPGSPEEAVATAQALALQLSEGGRPTGEAFELACSLAKRVAF